MTAHAFKVYSPADGAERLAEILAEVAGTGQDFAVYADGTFNPDSPDVVDPIAHLVPVNSNVIAAARQARLQVEAMGLQVQQGHQATRREAIDQAIRALAETHAPVTTANLTKLAKAIEKFVIDGTVVDGNGTH